MEIEESIRRRLGIARDMHELESFSLTAKLGHQTGFPVLVIPFGATEAEGMVIQDEAHLADSGPGLLKNGVFGLAHVIKVATSPR